MSTVAQVCAPFQMQKSLISKEYQSFLSFLKQTRQERGMTQVQLAKKLKATQSFVSKAERGERRLDIIELRRWTRARGLGFAEFAADFETYLKRRKNKNE